MYIGYDHLGQFVLIRDVDYYSPIVMESGLSLFLYMCVRVRDRVCARTPKNSKQGKEGERAKP